MSQNPLLRSNDFSEETFEGLDLRAASVGDKEFESCTFRKCNLSGTFLKNCRFLECAFLDCDLSNLQVHGCSFKAVHFKNCKAVGINWANALAVTHLNFEKSVLNYANFLGLDLRKSTLKDCVAREVDFADANFSEVDFCGTDLAASRFSNTTLIKADFRRATSYSIRPDSNNIKKAKFSLPEATLLLYGLDIDLEE